MKPIEPTAAQKPAPQKPTTTTTTTSQDLGRELKQRVWQLLIPQLEAAAADALTLSALTTSNASPSPSEGSTRDRHDRDQTSELTSTAFLLASAVQQLTRSHYTDDTPQLSDVTRPGEQAFNVRLEESDANGGTASVDVWNPQLGDVSLEVELSNGAVRVTATAENESSALVLQQGQAVLAQRLLNQGVVLEALDVVVRKRKKTAERARTRARKQER
jgi:hypothetical protein